MFYLCGILLLYHVLDARCCRFFIVVIVDDWYFVITVPNTIYLYLTKISHPPPPQHNINQQPNNSPPNLETNQTLVSNDTFSTFTNLFFMIGKLLICWYHREFYSLIILVLIILSNAIMFIGFRSGTIVGLMIFGKFGVFIVAKFSILVGVIDWGEVRGLCLLLTYRALICKVLAICAYYCYWSLCYFAYVFWGSWRRLMICSPFIGEEIYKINY